jgi:hypothetical protein
VAWRDSRGSYGARVSKTGVVTDSSGIRISTRVTGQTQNAVAFDGTNYVAVWYYVYGQRIPSYYVYGARVSADGSVLDTGGIQMTDSWRAKASPGISFGGANYLVVWEASGITGARLTPSGLVLDTSGFTIASGNKSNAALTFNGVDHTVVWEDKRSPSYPDIYGARVSQSGIVIDSFPVSVQAGSQLSPKIAHGPGDQVLVVYSGWTDSINHRPANTMRIWGKLLSQVGIEEDQISSIKYQKANLQIHPNPFRRQVRIELTMGQVAKGVELKIYDVSGRMVKSFPLASRTSLLATSSIAWDGTDDRGAQLPAGVYFCRLGKHSDCVTRKVVKLE